MRVLLIRRGLRMERSPDPEVRGRDLVLAGSALLPHTPGSIFITALDDFFVFSGFCAPTCELLHAGVSSRLYSQIRHDPEDPKNPNPVQRNSSFNFSVHPS
ncbi:uncharacterized [Tachysurus ichikawai]